MAHLTKQVVNLVGLAPALVAAAGGGDTFDPDADTWIEVENTGGSPCTVTVVTPKLDPKTGQAEGDIVVSVPATTGKRKIGPFPAEVFADSTNQNRAAITYSGVTGVTVGAFTAPRIG